MNFLEKRNQTQNIILNNSFYIISEAMQESPTIQGKIQYPFKQFPQITEAKKKRVLVGVRPFRKGQIRLEVQKFGNKSIVHNYGHGGAGVSLAPACALQVAELVSIQKPVDSRVSVLGSGINGILSALQCAKKGMIVTIFANRIPLANEQEALQMCTSEIAPGFWCPNHVQITDIEKYKKRASIAYQYYKSISKRSQSITPQIYFRVRDKKWVSDSVPIQLSKNLKYLQLKIGQTKMSGVSFETLQIHLQNLLQQLIQECKEQKIQFVQRKFNNLEQVLQLKDQTIVNCLGLASKYIFNDNLVYGRRGHLIQLQNSSQVRGIYGFPNSFDLYCLKDKLLLGYSNDEHQTVEIDQEISKRVESRAFEFYQQLLANQSQSKINQEK